jgi:hypothetical protein
MILPNLPSPTSCSFSPSLSYGTHIKLFRHSDFLLSLSILLITTAKRFVPQIVPTCFPSGHPQCALPRLSPFVTKLLKQAFHCLLCVFSAVSNPPFSPRLGSLLKFTANQASPFLQQPSAYPWFQYQTKFMDLLYKTVQDAVLFYILPILNLFQFCLCDFFLVAVPLPRTLSHFLLFLLLAKR